MPTPRLNPPFWNQVRVPGDRLDQRDAVLAFLAAHPADAASERMQHAGGTALAALDVVDVVDPLVRGADRQHERRADRDDADFRSLARQALAEEEDQDEGDRRDERHQPRVLEEPHRTRQPFSTSTSSRSALCRLR